MEIPINENSDNNINNNNNAPKRIPPRRTKLPPIKNEDNVNQNQPNVSDNNINNKNLRDSDYNSNFENSNNNIEVPNSSLIVNNKNPPQPNLNNNINNNPNINNINNNPNINNINNNNNINQNNIINNNNNNNINFNSNENIVQKIVKIPNNCFVLNIQGIIECAQFFTSDSIFCKYDIVYGPDWKVISGQTSGQSQHACIGGSAYNFFVWNFPFETSFYSNNPIGWPKLVISCFYPDFFGREKLKGYGVIHIPCREGVHFRNLQMFSPISGNIVSDLIEFFKGQKAEIVNAPKVLNTGEGREIMKTESIGSLKVKFTIGMDNMKELGYEI